MILELPPLKTRLKIWAIVIFPFLVLLVVEIFNTLKGI